MVVPRASRRHPGADRLLRLDGHGLAYRQIYRALRELILGGELGRAARLPATRVLAHQLGVARNTVLLAYRQLLGEGYAGGRIGSGTYVAPDLPDALVPAPPRGRGLAGPAASPRLAAFARRLAPAPTIGPPGASARWDFRYGVPVAGAFPFRLWRRLVAAEARRTSPVSLRYAGAEGHRPLREAIADYLRRSRGVQCDADQVVVTNGSQQAVDLAARVLLDPGDRVVLEEPHYPGAREALRGVGARLMTVAVDAEGLQVARLERLRRGVRLVSVTPSHPRSASATSSPRRRSSPRSGPPSGSATARRRRSSRRWWRR